MKSLDPPGFTQQGPPSSPPAIDLRQARVAIVGLGLMGGSLAMALRGRCARLIGVDRDEATLDLAKRRMLVDKATDDAAQALPQANLVVLSVPVSAILSFLDELPRLHPGSAVVLDLGSTKKEITAAMARLPERFQPIGGHPMCGKEKSGLEHAEAGLFQGAPFALTVLPRTGRQAIDLATELVQTVGARPVWLDSETHDRWVASTSHLPYLVACALAATMPEEAAPLIGSGYRSTSRLAASPVSVMLDILLTNREEVLAAVERFHGMLVQMRDLLADGQKDEELRRRLEEINRRQVSLLPDGYSRRS